MQRRAGHLLALAWLHWGKGIRQRCRCTKTATFWLPGGVVRTPAWLDPRSICAHRANPRLSFPPKRGELGTRPLCGHRTPIDVPAAMCRRPGARVGVTGWPFARGSSSNSHHPFGKHLHLASAPRRPTSPSTFETRSATTATRPPSPPATRLFCAAGCESRTARLGRSRLSHCQGPVRVKPDRSRRTVGSYPPSGRSHCLSGCSKESLPSTSLYLPLLVWGARPWTGTTRRSVTTYSVARPRFGGGPARGQQHTLPGGRTGRQETRGGRSSSELRTRFPISHSEVLAPTIANR